MPGLNHVRKEGAVNVVSAGVSTATLQRLDKRCAELGVPRSLVIRDFINFCLDIADGGDVIAEIKAAQKRARRNGGA